MISDVLGKNEKIKEYIMQKFVVLFINNITNFKIRPLFRK